MQYSVVVLGATENVGGRIVELLIKNPLCKRLVIVTRRKTDVFAAPKVFEVIVNMDRLEEELAPYAPGSRRRPRRVRRWQGQREDARGGGAKIEIAYPEAFLPRR
jgi:hypothetical protein